MELKEKNLIYKSIYYHEGVLVYYKNKLKNCTTNEERILINKNIEKEEDKIYDLKSKLNMI